MVCNIEELYVFVKAIHSIKIIIGLVQVTEFRTTDRNAVDTFNVSFIS